MSGVSRDLMLTTGRDGFGRLYLSARYPKPVRVGSYGPYATYVFDAPDTGEVGDAAADESNERSPQIGRSRARNRPIAPFERRHS